MKLGPKAAIGNLLQGDWLSTAPKRGVWELRRLILTSILVRALNMSLSVSAYCLTHI